MRHDDLLAMRHRILADSQPRQLEQAIRNLGPNCRGIADQLLQQRAAFPKVLCHILGLPMSPQQEHPVVAEVAAVGCVLAHVVLDQLDLILSSDAEGRAYELYHAEEVHSFFAFGEERPATLSKAVVEELQCGETRLLALIVREAVDRIGAAAPSSSLFRIAHSSLKQFKIVANEAYQTLAVINQPVRELP